MNGFNLNLLDPIKATVSKYKDYSRLNAIREVIYQN